jgi:hypothetical protein
MGLGLRERDRSDGGAPGSHLRLVGRAGAPSPVPGSRRDDRLSGRQGNRQGAPRRQPVKRLCIAIKVNTALLCLVLGVVVAIYFQVR